MGAVDTWKGLACKVVSSSVTVGTNGPGGRDVKHQITTFNIRLRHSIISHVTSLKTYVFEDRYISWCVSLWFAPKV